MNLSNKEIRTNLSIKDMTQIGIFTALTAVGAFISIPLGPVPITLQTLFVLLSGLILGSKKALLSQIVYVLLGLTGLPIFAGFSGGLQTVLKPSFGFMIGFIVAAYVIGKLTEKNQYSVNKMIFSVLVGSIIIYAIGIPYMYYILNGVLSKGLNIIQVLKLGMFLFVPGDVLKAFVAVLLSSKLQGKLNATQR